MISRWLTIIAIFSFCFTSTLAQEATPNPAPSIEELAKMFTYDASLPLNVQEKGVTDHDGIAVHDITFDSPIAGTSPVSAYVVVPPGDGPFAGVLFVHWLGRPNANRDEFLNDALTLAHMGTVSVLVTAGWSQAGFWNRDFEHDRDASIKQVVDLRRAIDVLLSQPNVDPERMGVVGHDFGGMYSSILAGVDRRASAYVIMAATTRLSDWFVPFGGGAQLNAEQTTQYIQDMSVFDPIVYIAEANPAELLFQFARGDQYVPEDQWLAFYQAASEPRRLELYDTDHAMALQAATDARIAWLKHRLKLSDPS